MLAVRLLYLISCMKQYRTNPDITKERLVIETLEQVLPDAEVYIMNDDGNTMKYFPIRPLEKARNENGRNKERK